MTRTSMSLFFEELPFFPPLFTTPKGDAVVHLAARADVVELSYLSSIKRGAGRAALTKIIEIADRHAVTLALTAKPQPATGGKLMTPAELEAFYVSFGFVTTGYGEFLHAWFGKPSQ